MAQPRPPPPQIAVQPAPQAIAAQPPNNGSTSFFQGLIQNRTVLTQNYDFVKAFQRSIKVFRMSYPEINLDNCPPFHTQKYQEYLNEMATLYNQNQPDMSFLNQMNTDIRGERFHIMISCKRVVGRDVLTNPKFVITFQGYQLKRDLDLNRELQPYDPLIIAARFDNFTTSRSNDIHGLMLSIEEVRPIGQQPHQQPLGHFNLRYAVTHPEGFQDWIDFGRGVRLLINVCYKVKDEVNVTAEEVSTFHLRTIELMLRKRLQAFTAMGGNLRSFHQMGALKKRVCYRRQFIDRQTDSYFWSRPNIGTPFVASNLNLTQRGTTTVRFIDMQIGFETNEDFEESVCLCSEWCNWNAFFHHNPIYRFLLVRHRQLFITNMSNIPNMYLCLTVLLGSEPTPTIQKPILQLMYCANEYRKRYYDNFYLKNRNKFLPLYTLSRPEAMVMDGLSYNRLRNYLNITQLCHILDPNPFAEICIENLMHYYDVLISLHQHISSVHRFVSNKELWTKDMDILGRNKYSDYIKQSYDKCISQLIVGYDSLFTDDYEYSTQLPKSEAHREIRTLRDRVKWSPFNVWISSSVFLNTFASVYKYLSKFEAILPVTYRKESKELVYRCFQRMDIDFNAFRNANINLDFELDSTRSGFNNLQQNFDVFYTLKLYFYAFEIQKHSINAVLNYNRSVTWKSVQVAKTFDFIWNYEFFEQNYRNTYNGEVLFQIEDFEALFTDFYEQFWGRAQHETQQLQNLLDIVDSGHFQYQRLLFWYQNNGNNRIKFTRIIDSLNTSLTNIRQRVDEININHICSAIAFLSNIPGFPLTPEIANRPVYLYGGVIWDHLMYYLVKTYCSVTLSTVAMFFKPLHALQLDHLCTNHTSLTICKPGWILLISTMTAFLNNLDDLKTSIIVFDDEFNRISNTFDQTIRMIKDIYRQFYSKLTNEWITELSDCVINIGHSTPNLIEFIQFHIAFGLSFCAFFADDFRLEFATSRKQLFHRLNISAQLHLQHQLAFNQCLPIVSNYLGNRQLIALAQPMTGPPWQQHLQQTLIRFSQLNGQQLNIDLNAADV